MHRASRGWPTRTNKLAHVPQLVQIARTAQASDACPIDARAQVRVLQRLEGKGRVTGIGNPAPARG